MNGSHKCPACGHVDLSLAESRALLMVAVQDNCDASLNDSTVTSAQLAKYLERPTTTVCNQLRDLERLGLVIRKAVPCNNGKGRMMLTRLTEAGRKWRAA